MRRRREAEADPADLVEFGRFSKPALLMANRDAARLLADGSERR
jgi:hypothetical protein